MAKKYTIRDGFSFVRVDGEVKSGGDIVELDDDVAANHAHKLELVAEDAPAPVGKQAKAPQKADATTAPDTTLPL